MITCTVCSEEYWPTGRWRDDICPGCFDANFAASQELRVEDAPVTDAQREADHRRYVEACQAATPSLTPRQVEAMRRMAERWRHEEDADAI
jgi:hypothetical protein